MMPSVPSSDTVEHVATRYHRDELVLGFRGRACSFEPRPLDQGTPAQMAADKALREDLLQHGMLDPLVTHRGHVLVGMRRFQILQGRAQWFDCIEITEDVSAWTADDIRRLRRWLAQTGRGSRYVA